MPSGGWARAWPTTWPPRRSWPRSPSIRAAAFRALAAFPGAKNLGPVKGGQSLLLTFPKDDDPWIKLVVDPATSLVHSYATIKGTIVINTAEWTNHLPRIIPLPPKDACLHRH